MISKTILYTPFTGLGLYGGFRGNRWLRNRINIFKKFVIPSMQNQTDRRWVHWISWRAEDVNNKHIKELGAYLDSIKYPYVFTYAGICFWDDKYEDDVARTRLFDAFKGSLPTLMDVLTDCDEVRLLLVPSDDLYESTTVEGFNKQFDEYPELQAVGYLKGYLCNYNTKEVLEYNPNTNPPFFAYRTPRDIFIDPGKHMNYISTKVDEGKYKAGTPYPSHEWIPNAFKMAFFASRGFMVGTHGENISTHFNHPFGGRRLEGEEKEYILSVFGIGKVEALKLPISVRKWAMRKLPYRWQRKLRYIFGEMLYNKFYNYIRN